MPIPFPCPDCETDTGVYAGRPRDPDYIRYRHCPECDRRFKTVESRRQPETFWEWHNPDDGEDDEIEPLDMATVGTKQDRREQMRAMFVCCKGRVNGKGRTVLNSGYSLDSRRAFYRD